MEVLSQLLFLIRSSEKIIPSATIQHKEGCVQWYIAV